MRIGILAEKDGWHVTDLLRASTECGHEAHRIAWTTLRAAVGCVVEPGVVSSSSDSLDAFDAILPRTMPIGTLEQIVFRMDVLHRLMAAGVRIINPPRAIECAVDKYLALCHLERAGLPVPPTVTCQIPADALAAFDALGCDVVVKPLFGSEGFGLMRLTERAAAQRVFHALARVGAVLYIQRFIHALAELRLFVVGPRVVGSMRRFSSGWPANIARGARAEPYEPSDYLRGLAVRAAEACHCDIAGVDIVIDQHDQPLILEVNAAPGWRALTRVTAFDIASAIVKFAEAPSGSPCHV